MIPGALRRALAVGALLLIEGLCLGVRFDAASLAQLRHHWWARPLAYVSEVPRVAIAIGTLLLLGSIQRLRQQAKERARDERPTGDPLPAPRDVSLHLALHVAALGAFVLLTRQVFEAPEEIASRWVLPWLAAGILVVAFLLPLITPVRVLWSLARGATPFLSISVVVGLGAWAAGHATRGLSSVLQHATSRAVFLVLSQFRRDAFHEPELFVVGTPRFEVEIAPACSGYEGIGLIAVFLAAFLWTYRASLRFPAALVLVPLGVACALLANVARLAILVLVGEVAPAVAQGGFHSYAGAVLFSAIALGIAFVAQRHPLFALEPPAPQADGDDGVSNDDASPDAFVAPFVVFLAVQLLTGLFRAGAVDTLYPVRVIAGAGVLWFFRARVTVETKRLDPAAIALGAGVAVAWLLLTSDSAEATEALVLAARERPTALVAVWLVFRVLGSVIVVPIVEELAFRGYLLRRLVARDFGGVDHRAVTLVPIAVSSVAFGLMHTEIVAGVVAGIAYALAVRRRGRLLDAIVAHAVTNALLIVYAAVTGRWSAWL